MVVDAYKIWEVRIWSWRIETHKQGLEARRLANQPRRGEGKPKLKSRIEEEAGEFLPTDPTSVSFFRLTPPAVVSDAMDFDFVIENSAADAEELGGILLNPVGHLEGLDNCGPLEIVQLDA
jgi:hypothetical protein